MIKKDLVLALIINKKNEVLLQKKTLDYLPAPGNWCMFGGEIEKNEDPKRALIRELWEELGINFKEDQLKMFKSFTYKEKLQKGRFFCFLILFNFSSSEISLNEGAGFSFFSKEELKSLKMASFNKQIVEEYFGIF